MIICGLEPENETDQPFMPVLLTERDGQILSLTLNRPERANALSGELIESLRQAFEKAEFPRSPSQ